MFVKTLESLIEPPDYRNHRQGGERSNYVLQTSVSDPDPDPGGQK
jgi:hypothetical protein